MHKLRAFRLMTWAELGRDSLSSIDTLPLPETPASRQGDLWLLGPHRVLCGDATNAEAVARLLGERKPRLLVRRVWRRWNKRSQGTRNDGRDGQC